MAGEIEEPFSISFQVLPAFSIFAFEGSTLCVIVWRALAWEFIIYCLCSIWAK